MTMASTSPSKFMGQSWSTWSQFIGSDSPRNEEMASSRNEDDLTNPLKFMGQSWTAWSQFMGGDSPRSDDDIAVYESDCTRLPREDMGLFGHCPEWDPFYTVVCEQCDALVKPQGLKNHVELRHCKSKSSEHSQNIPEKSIKNKSDAVNKANANNSGGSSTKIKVKKRTSTPTSTPSSTTVSSNSTRNIVTDSVKESLVCGSSLIPEENTSIDVENLNVQILPDNVSVSQLASLQFQPVNSPVSPQPVEPMNVPLNVSSIGLLSIIPKLVSPVQTSENIVTTPVSVSVVNSDNVEIQSQYISSHQKKKSKSESKSTVAQKREYDPDRHCGVLCEKSNKPCTRSLTCKHHSLTMRRAVNGRSKRFDKLLAEHRVAKESGSKSGRSSGQYSFLETELAQIVSPQNNSGNMLDSSPQFVATSLSDPALVVEVPAESAMSFPVISSDVSYLTSSVASSLPQHPEIAIEIVDKSASLLSTIPIVTSVSDDVEEICLSDMQPENEKPKYEYRQDNITWQRFHPRPLAIGFGYFARKAGGLITTNRKIEVIRQGLHTALTQGIMRLPLPNEFYSTSAPAPTNHSTMKSLLTNICTKRNYQTNPNKLILPNVAKSVNPIAQKPQRTVAPSTATIKTVLPKSSLTAQRSPVNNTFSSSPLTSIVKRPAETVISNIDNKRKREN